MSSTKIDTSRGLTLRYQREYWKWQGMKARCLRPTKRRDYLEYGGRGIKVCDRWLGKDGFKNFLLDMGLSPEGTSLDRIDVDGNYSLANCRWADDRLQMINKRLQKNNTTGHKGIHFRKDIKKWRAAVHVYGKNISLGTYPTFEEAVKARKEGEARFNYAG